jgi:hypothetical protein
VTGFVTKDAPALGLTSALHLEHLAAFKLHEARMRQIEGNGKTEHAVRIEEFFRQIHVGQGRNIPRLQLAMKPSHPALY